MPIFIISKKNFVMNPIYIFREAQNTEDLSALFKMRYKVYSNSRVAKFSIQNPSQMDLDSYDIYAKHFGLFTSSNGIEKPVGYLRVIQDTTTSVKDKVLKIASVSKMLTHRVTQPPQSPLPMMSYFPKNKLIGKFYKIKKDQGSRLVEASRLVFDQSKKPIWVTRGFVKACIAVNLLTHNNQFAFVGCALDHTRFYQEFGFEFVGKDGQEVHGIEFFLLAISKNRIAEKYKTEIRQMSEVYQRNNCICFHPTKPGYFLPPKGVNVSISEKEISVPFNPNPFK